MKFLKYIFLFGFIPSIFFSQSFQIFKRDTINHLDKENKKYGKWIVFSSKPKCDKDSIIIEKGNYLGYKKTGVWEEYFCSGILRTKITFSHGRPEGIVSIYHENGKLHETGLWKNNKWVGKYIREQELDSLGRKEGKSIFNFTEYEPFLINGEAALYNSKNQILKEGVFKDNRLTDGKVYIYDDQGKLSRTTLYIAGIYAGDLKK